MKCEECGKDTDGIVCKNCGLVIDVRLIATNLVPRVYRDNEPGNLASLDHDAFEHPLLPAIRRKSKAFKPKYQKMYNDYVYIKAYGAINKFCAQLRLSKNVRFEALNLFKGIRKLDPDFFQSYKLGPTYLACIKIACKINDFPISNYELANVIDYQANIAKKNTSYMERKFNRAYRAILSLYKLRIKLPKHPNFIGFACNKLKLPYKIEKKVHKQYIMLRRFFQPHFRVEGYILALIHIFGKIRLNMLEKAFHTSSKTIVNRRNEILKLCQ